MKTTLRDTSCPAIVIWYLRAVVRSLKKRAGEEKFCDMDERECREEKVTKEYGERRKTTTRLLKCYRRNRYVLGMYVRVSEIEEDKRRA